MAWFSIFLLPGRGDCGRCLLRGGGGGDEARTQHADPAGAGGWGSAPTSTSSRASASRRRTRTSRRPRTRRCSRPTRPRSRRSRSRARPANRRRCARRNSAWQVVGAGAGAGRRIESSGLATSLASLEEQRVIEEKPKDLAPYGLAPARIEITFKAAGDKDSATPPHRRQDRDRQRDVREARRQAEGLPDLAVSRMQASTRPPSSCARRTSSRSTARRSTASPSITRRPCVQLARAGDVWTLKQPWVGPRRLRRRGGAAVAAVDRPDEVDRHPGTRRRSRSTGSTRRETKVTLTVGSSSAGLICREGHAAG